MGIIKIHIQIDTEKENNTTIKYNNAIIKHGKTIKCADFF